MIPPELLKLAVSVLWEPLSNGIRFSLSKALFQTILKFPWVRHSAKVLL